MLYRGTILEHTGHIGYYRTNLTLLAEHEISIILLSNATAESPQMDREAEDMMEKLKSSIPDEAKRHSEISRILHERHPDKRIAPMEQIFPFFFKE